MQLAKTTLKHSIHVLRSMLPKSSKATFLYYPAFTNNDDFTDQYYRMLWHFNPIIDRIGKIIIPFIGDVELRAGEPPKYLDASIKALMPKFAGKLQFEPFKPYFPQADVVMLWRKSDESEAEARKRYAGKRLWTVDHHQVRYAASLYLKAVSEFDMDVYQSHIAESREKFLQAFPHLRAEVGYIFGTGPNLQQVVERDYRDGVAIACNSMLKHKAFMENLRPPLIAVADPIFHAGPSAYAGQFRAYLHDAMETFGSYLVVPMRDYILYTSNLDPRWRDRIIGVPFIDGATPNLNLTQEFHITTTSNIMTIFLIPLATTLFNTIYMAGFDGRPIEENNYFWKHDPASQIVTEMDSIQLAHPAFFNIDYDDYYLTHIDVVERWLKAGEAQGKTFYNLTPSYVPALQQRTIKSL